jgi:hypothetical protein
MDELLLRACLLPGQSFDTRCRGCSVRSWWCWVLERPLSARMQPNFLIALWNQCKPCVRTWRTSRTWTISMWCTHPVRSKFQSCVRSVRLRW